MAHITINFRSSVLAMPVMLDVLLPENAGNCKTLYLLHGYGGGRESILLKSRIAELVEGRQIAVIMPSGNNKLFINNKNGKAYHTFVTEELPGRVEKWFSVSPKASDRFLAGVDTGAFGAVYAGLYKPELYHTVFGFQTVLFAEGLRQILRMRDIETVFGTQEEFEACALDALIYLHPNRNHTGESYRDCSHQSSDHKYHEYRLCYRFFCTPLIIDSACLCNESKKSDAEG